MDCILANVYVKSGTAGWTLSTVRIGSTTWRTHTAEIRSGKGQKALFPNSFQEDVPPSILDQRPGGTHPKNRLPGLVYFDAIVSHAFARVIVNPGTFQEEFEAQVCDRVEPNDVQFVGHLIVAPIAVFSAGLIDFLTLSDNRCPEAVPQIGSQFPYVPLPLRRRIALRVGLRLTVSRCFSES